MKRSLIILATFISILMAPSCKKDDGGTPTRRDMLIGTWMTYQEGDDDNSNGVFDEGEKVNVAESAAYKYTFNSDGSGNVKTPLGTASILWTLENNDENLKVVVVGVSSVTIGIISVENNYATVIDDITATQKSFTIYKKI